MTRPIISIRHVTKEFSFNRNSGIKGMFHPHRMLVQAVTDVSLSINRGESVAFIGPNGAGKSTTIKMLCGILAPTRGAVRVLGMDPLKDRRSLALRIGTVFGQRSQLIYNLPLVDSLRLTAVMYRVPRSEVDQRVREVTTQFALDEFLLQPVRKLSLGQRMRAEIANSLFAKPEVIFLDEPTIGLDVVAKRALRETIVEANRAGTTIFLTSHDVGDIEAIAGRTIVVNHGRIMLDTTTDNLNAQYLYTKKVRVLAKHKIATTLRILDQAPQEVDGRWATFSVDTKESDLKSFIEALMQAIDIADLTVADTPLENIIHDIYTRESA